MAGLQERCPQTVDVESKKEGGQAESGGGHGCFAAGVACAYDNQIEAVGEGLDVHRGQAPGRRVLTGSGQDCPPKSALAITWASPMLLRMLERSLGWWALGVQVAQTTASYPIRRR